MDARWIRERVRERDGEGIDGGGTKGGHGGGVGPMERMQETVDDLETT